MNLCDYCNQPVDEETWGWGYMLDEYEKYYFHSECLEVCEGITA